MNITSFPTLVCLLIALCCTTVQASSSAYPSTTFHNTLVDAADRGDASQVARLIRNGAAVDSRGDFGVTPLMRAALKGDSEVVKLLIELGADTDAVDLGGATALHLATRQGNEEVVKLLLQADAMVDMPDNEGWTPLMRIVASKKPTLIPLFLKKQASLTKNTKLGDNALTLAIKSGNTETVTTLVNSPGYARLPAQEKTKLRQLASQSNNAAMLTALSPATIPASTTPVTADKPASKKITAPAATKPASSGFFSFFKRDKQKEQEKQPSVQAKTDSKKDDIAAGATPVVTVKPVTSASLPPVLPAPAKVPAKALPAKAAAAPVRSTPPAPVIAPVPVVTPPAKSKPAPVASSSIPAGERIEVGKAIRVPLSNDLTEKRQIATYSPSIAKETKKKLWLQAGNYASEAEATAAYEAIQGNSAATGVRMRIVSALKDVQGVALRLGPLNEQNASALCPLLKTDTVSCSIVRDFGKSTVISRTPGGNNNYVHPANRMTAALAQAGEYWLQFGTFPSENAAVSERETLQSSYADIAQKMRFIITVPRAGSNQQSAFRLRGGAFVTHEEASAICDKFSSRGVNCIVVSD